MGLILILCLHSYLMFVTACLDSRFCTVHPFFVCVQYWWELSHTFGAHYFVCESAVVRSVDLFYVHTNIMNCHVISSLNWGKRSHSFDRKLSIKCINRIACNLKPSKGFHTCTRTRILISIQFHILINLERIWGTWERAKKCSLMRMIVYINYCWTIARGYEFLFKPLYNFNELLTVCEIEIDFNMYSITKYIKTVFGHSMCPHTWAHSYLHIVRLMV